MQESRPIQSALIIEDHPVVADSLRACVRECNHELEVNSTQSLCEALRVLAVRPSPLLIVTDLGLPDSKGAEAVRQLREAAPRSPLIVFTALDDDALRREAMQLGAICYLIKSTSIQAIRDTIRAVLGERPATNNTAPETTDAAALMLTPKQQSVLEELAAGRSNKEIAARMGISNETVGSHMKEILGRLGARNRTEAVVRYLQIINRVHDPSMH